MPDTSRGANSRTRSRITSLVALSLLTAPLLASCSDDNAPATTSVVTVTQTTEATSSSSTPTSTTESITSTTSHSYDYEPSVDSDSSYGSSQGSSYSSGSDYSSNSGYSQQAPMYDYGNTEAPGGNYQCSNGDWVSSASDCAVQQGSGIPPVRQAADGNCPAYLCGYGTDANGNQNPSSGQIQSQWMGE